MNMTMIENVYLVFVGAVATAAFGTWLLTEGIIRRRPFIVIVGWTLVAAAFYLSGLFTAAM